MLPWIYRIPRVPVYELGYCMDHFQYNLAIIFIKGSLCQLLLKYIIMEFIQSQASMDISSSTYECPYVNEDNA